MLFRSHMRMRVWERGSGETFACGTGACAAVAAGIAAGRTRDSVKVSLLGGTLDIDYDRQNETMYMTGPAREVFEGWTDKDKDSYIQAIKQEFNQFFGADEE